MVSDKPALLHTPLSALDYSFKKNKNRSFIQDNWGNGITPLGAGLNGMLPTVPLGLREIL